MARYSAGSGNWVAGDQFFDRVDETQRMIDLLVAGNNVNLIAPRRVGKTSLMRQVARKMETSLYTCIFADLEHAASCKEAILEIGDAIAKQTVGELQRKVVSGVTKLFRAIPKPENIELDAFGFKFKTSFGDHINDGNWKRVGDALLDELAGLEKDVILFLDEVPTLVSNLLKLRDRPTAIQTADAEAFLSWLRASAQRHQGKIRQVIAGSIGFQPILEKVSLTSYINHLEDFQLFPWDRETTKAFLDDLARDSSLTFADGAADVLLDNLGIGVPHFAKVYFDFLSDRCREEKTKAITIDMVRRVFVEKLLARLRKDLVHQVDRLKIALSEPEQALAVACLTEAARAEILTVERIKAIAANHQPARPSHVIGLLEHDGYLTRRVEGGYAMTNPLLKEHWLRADDLDS